MKKEKMGFKSILFDLEMGVTTIEEVAKSKKVAIKTIIKNLRQIGCSIVEFRMWNDFERERERLSRLCMNGMLTNFDEREAWLESGEYTEGGYRPMGDLFDINDSESYVEYEEMGMQEGVENIHAANMEMSRKKELYRTDKDGNPL